MVKERNAPHPLQYINERTTIHSFNHSDMEKKRREGCWQHFTNENVCYLQSKEPRELHYTYYDWKWVMRLTLCKKRTTNRTAFVYGRARL